MAKRYFQRSLERALVRRAEEVERLNRRKLRPRKSTATNAHLYQKADGSRCQTCLVQILWISERGKCQPQIRECFIRTDIEGNLYTMVDGKKVKVTRLDTNHLPFAAEFVTEYVKKLP